MRYIVKCLFFLLFPISAFAIDNTTKLDQLLQQKVRNNEWYTSFSTELTNTTDLKIERLNEYAINILQDKSLELKSAQRVKLVRSFVKVYDKLGAYEESIAIIKAYFKELGSDAYSDEFAFIWFDLIYDYDALSKTDSVKYVVETTKRFIKVKSPKYYYWLLANQILLSNEEKYSESIKVAFEALKFFEKENNLDREAACYNALGNSYAAMKNFKDAITYYLQAIEINNKLGLKDAVARNYNNVGAMYSGLKDLNKASEAYEMAYEIISKIGDIQLLAQNLTNRGNIFEKQGDYVQSKKMFQECLELCEQHNIQFGIMLSNINLGNTYFLMKEYELAETLFNKGLDLAINIKAQHIEALAYEKLSKLYVAKKNFEKAFHMIDKFHKIDDNLRSDKLKKETLELKEKYDSEKKSNTISVLKGQKIAQQLIIALLIGGILLLIVVIQLYRNRQKQALLESALVLNEKNTLKRVVEAKEKELTVQITQLMQLQDEVKLTHDKVISLIDNNIETPDSINKKIRNILSNKTFDGVNEAFNQRISEVNEDLFKQLLGQYPELTPTELKLCAYLRLGLSTKEIAQLLNKSVRTIESTRTDIRKKLKLSPEINLVNHLITFGS